MRQRQEHLERDLAEPLDPNSSGRAVEMEDDAALEAQAALVAREIASIGRALERIAGGTYGECVSCGEQIAPGRLESGRKPRFASAAPAGSDIGARLTSAPPLRRITA